MVDGRGESTTGHDARGRVVQVQDADGGRIEYAYDAVGNLIARVSPSQSLLYAYDARHRLVEVTRSVDGEAPSITRYEYDASGNRSAMSGGDGTRTEYGYDLRHRLRSLVKKTAAGALLLALNYSVDASGMRSAVEESDPAGLIRSVAYRYDGVKRLVEEAIDHRDEGHDRRSLWTYDRVGNRLTQTVDTRAGSETTRYEYDRNDRLGTEIRAGVATVYAYDANGNTTAKAEPGALTEYVYDDANRLIEARTQAATTRYSYDADGLRVRQTVTPTGGEPTTTYYLQDNAYPYAQVIEQYTRQGNGPKRLSATFTFADELVSQTRYDAAGTPETTFVQADGFGSTRWVTDAAGSVTDSIDYDAFGVEIGREGTTEVEHLYRGERWNANVAAYDLRARLYTPGNGRFLTHDTFAGFSQDPRSLHKYGYVHSDPVNGVDPTGHFMMTELIANDLLLSASVRASISMGAQAVSRAALGRLTLYVAAATYGTYKAMDSATKTTMEECIESSRRGKHQCKPDFAMFIVADDYPEVRDHVGAAIADGKDSMLSRKQPSHSRSWISAHKGAGKACDGGSNTECDEYPWAASMQGGRQGNVSLKSVNASQNGGVGAHLRWFHHTCGVPANDNTYKYKVLAVEGLPKTGYVCRR